MEIEKAGAANLPGLGKKFFQDPKAALAEILALDKVRFALVGTAATLSYLILGLVFVNGLKFAPLAGNTLAYLLSFIISYLGQCRWTFRAKGEHWRMLPRFALTQGLGLALNSLIILLCMKPGLPHPAAMIIATVIVPVFVYLASKYWVFSQKGERA